MGEGWGGLMYDSGLDLSHVSTWSIPKAERAYVTSFPDPLTTWDLPDPESSFWRWLTPQYHDTKVLKKKQRKEIERKREEWTKKSVLGSYEINSMKPMDSPTGILFYMDPFITGSNNFKP